MGISTRIKHKSKLKSKSKAFTLSKRIIQYLQSISPRPATPKEVAFELGTDYATTKGVIAYLHRHKYIEKATRGNYRAQYSLEDILKSESPEMRLHGIKIEGELPKGEQASAFYLLFKDSEPASGRRKMFKSHCEGRTVTMQLSESGLIEISLRGSKYSLSYLDFNHFVGWLDGLFHNKSHLLSLKIVQLGIGRDFRIMRLEGVEALKLGQWTNAWAQIYNRKTDMRTEIHIQQRITLGDAINILRGMAAPQALEYEAQIEPGPKAGYG